MGEVLRADDRGRITLPITFEPYSLTPLWSNNTLFLVDSKELSNLMAEKPPLNGEIQMYRVKGLPYYIPKSFEPTNRITIPKAIRVSKFWEFEKTTFVFKSIDEEVPAYRLTPLAIVSLRESDFDVKESNSISIRKFGKGHWIPLPKTVVEMLNEPEEFYLRVSNDSIILVPKKVYR